MATAHLVHGFLGAGKTTFARRLERDCGAVRYSPDEWMVRRHGNDPPADQFARFLAAIFADINAEWPQVLAAGRDVVLDFGFWTREERDQARHRAVRVGAAVRLYRLECPEPVARARCRARNDHLDGSLVITDHTYDVLRARFEPLEPDEAFETVNG